MYEARFTTQQIYDNYKNAIKPKSRPTPKQRTDRGYVPTNIATSVASSKSTSRSTPTVETRADSYRKYRERRGSTYDEVPQSLVQKPEPKPVKETAYEKVLRVFNEAMEGFGVFDEPTQPTYDTVDTMNVYKDKRYFGPQVYSPDIDFKDPSLEDVSPKIFKDFNFPSIYKDLNTDKLPTLPESTTNILGVDTENPLLNRFGVGNKTDKPPAPLMSPPSVEVPANMDPMTRGLSQAMLPEPVKPTADYTTQAGDTLFSIQKTLKENGINTTVEEIAEINDIGLDGIFGIKPGTELKLPMPSTKLPTEFMDKETKAMLQETTPEKASAVAPNSFVNPDNPVVKTITDYLSKGMGGLFSNEKIEELPEKTFAMLKGAEKFEEKVYSLNDKVTIGGKPHKSGLTVGAGIDFGQHTEQSLIDMGMPSSMIKKAKDKGWIGLNPDTIIDPLTKKPAASRERGHELMYEKFKQQEKDNTLPTFTSEELKKATPIVYKPYEESARQQYENDTGKSFDDLSEGTKSVLTLEKYHRGTPYILPPQMIMSASIDQPLRAAESIVNSNRRKNIIYLLKINKLDKGKGIQSSIPPKVRPLGKK